MDIQAAISTMFGAPGSADAFFSIGVAEPPSAAQEAARVTIDAHKREINRLRGYKPVLTTTEQNRLRDIQTQVQAVERKAAQGIARPDELEDRLSLLDEADEIIGKPIVDAEADGELAEMASLMTTLLSPKLSPAQERRVAYLERIRAGMEERLSFSPDNKVLLGQVRSVIAHIDKILVPRQVNELSREEVKAYDDLAELINERAGAKIQLKSRDAIKVEQLERSIVQLQANLPPDTSKQPTPQAVANAYVSLVL